MNTGKPQLSQIKAIAQLAEMAYNADPCEHKKNLWDKALSDFEQAELEQVAPEADQVTLTVNTGQESGQGWGNATAGILSNIVDSLDKANQSLTAENKVLTEENTLLKNQSIEKDTKIAELENLTVSANPTAPAITPAAAPVAPKPLVGAAKVAAEKKAAALAETDDAKKNS